MQFPICHPREIEQTALLLANTILSRKSSLPDVLDHILSTAASQLSYTRSLALVVKKMIEDLQWRNSDLYITFQEELTDMAVATYIDYWSGVLGCGTGQLSSTRIEAVNPLAISAFIGDLASFGILNFGLFETSMAFLMNRMKTRLQLRCLHMLFAHAGAYHDPQMKPIFINDCLCIIRRRCGRYLQCFTIEEQLLRELLNDLIHRGANVYYRQVWDRRLNLDNALMASVVSPEIEKLELTPNSIDARSLSPSSASSLISRTNSPATSVNTVESVDQEPTTGKAVRHEVKIHQPRPIHPTPCLLVD